MNIIQSAFALREEIEQVFGRGYGENLVNIKDHTRLYWKRFVSNDGDTYIETHEKSEYLGYGTRYHYVSEPIGYAGYLLFHIVYRDIFILVNKVSEVK